MKKKTSRINREEIQKAIFRPNDEEPSFADTEEVLGEIDREVIVYTIFGQHDYLDENNSPCLFDDEGIEAEDRPHAYAKAIIIDDKEPRYSVRRDSSGKFFDPLGLYSEGRHNKLRHHTQNRQWEWVGINKRAFEYYLRYLQTKNKAHLINAEREAF